MQENNVKVSKNIHNVHKICIDNRKNLILTGVDKVDNATPDFFSCVIAGNNLKILGEMLEVKKIDVEEGVVELAGVVNSLSYLAEKKSFLKRIFK